MLEILYSSDHFIAIAKPAGLATIPGRGESDSVLEQLSRQLNLPCTGTADPRLRIVHRLDKDTSGVLLLAKNIAAQRHVSHQFQNNLVSKEYLAVVASRPMSDEGEIDAPLAPHPTSPRHMAISKQGRPAKTLWRVEKRFRGDLALLRVFPKTGKTHQIRVHLSSIGMPLLIDPLYNPKPPGTPTGVFLSHYKRDYRPTRNEEERPLISRLTLHAEKLTFQDFDGHAITVECPLPKDFRATINQLGKLGSR